MNKIIENDNIKNDKTRKMMGRYSLPESELVLNIKNYYDFKRNKSKNEQQKTSICSQVFPVNEQKNNVFNFNKNKDNNSR
jgi:hypothetical protein